MKIIVKDILLVILLGIVIPWITLNSVLRIYDRPAQNNSEDRTTAPRDTVSETADQNAPSIHDRSTDSKSICLILPNGEEKTLQIREYLVGVVLAEMPAFFEGEALKAQSVVARTYTLKVTSSGFRHGPGKICSNYACCQAYMDPMEYEKTGSTDAVDRFRSAVEDTDGQVLTFQGNLIEAVYFSCSGGFTEDAEAVWGTDFPYLRAISSPGEENAAHFTDTVYFSAEEFCTRIGQSLTGAPSSWLGPVEFTSGGGIRVMQIGNREYRGTELRTALGLRSTVISMQADTKGISITTRGFGHRVGMSQYGADAMAAQGSLYDDILAHYYQGTDLVSWEN